MSKSSLGDIELTPDKTHTLKGTEIKEVVKTMQNALDDAKKKFNKDMAEQKISDTTTLADMKASLVLDTIKEKVQTLTAQELAYYTAENNAQAK